MPFSTRASRRIRSTRSRTSEKREHADNDRNKIDAAVQGENIERKTRFGGKRGHAHTGEQQPEHAHGQPLELVVGRYAGNAGQAHQDQGARFKRPELQRRKTAICGAAKVGSRTRTRLRKSDAVVHSAGITRPACSILDMPVEEWENVIKVNLTGAFFLAKACIPPMLEAGQGAMVLFSSRPPKRALPPSAATARKPKRITAHPKQGSSRSVKSPAMELAPTESE